MISIGINRYIIDKISFYLMLKLQKFNVCLVFFYNFEMNQKNKFKFYEKKSTKISIFDFAAIRI